MVRASGWLRGLVLLGLLLAGYRFVVVTLDALTVFSDYHAYYRAAVNLRAGADLYAEGQLLVARNDYDFWTQTDGQYVYPPALAVALVPLTVVDIGKGGSVWLLLLVLAVVGLCWVSGALLGQRELGWFWLLVGAIVWALLPIALGMHYGTLDRYLLKVALPGWLGFVGLLSWRWWTWRAGLRERLKGLGGQVLASLPIVAVVLATPAVLLGIRFGQPDVGLVVLVLLALLGHLRGREVLAGIALGLAVAVKPQLALYGLFFLRKGQWRTLGVAAVVGAMVGLGPFLWLGGGAFGDWLTIARYFGSGDYLAYPSNHSWRGLLVRLFVGGPRHAALIVSPVLALVLWLLGVGAVLVGWWRVVGGPAEAASPERLVGSGRWVVRREVVDYALTALVVLFVSPLSEDIHFVGAVLALAILVGGLVAGWGTIGWRLLAGVACVLLLWWWPDSGEWVALGAIGQHGLSLVGPLGLLLAGGALSVLRATNASVRRT